LLAISDALSFLSFLQFLNYGPGILAHPDWLAAAALP
jgi:hypothetical protein